MSTDQTRLGIEEGRPTLSLCMIVKNEEEFLPRCLESVKDVADEMVIVDTGSTDRTVQIAERYGAKVYPHPWQNSFSEARNYGLQFATCDWVLQLDADEELEREDIPLLWEVLRSVHGNEEVNALFIAIYNEFSGGQQSKHYFQRIFRRGKAYYEGIVHNQLVYGGQTAPTEIRIRHYGYGLSREEMAKKHRRTGDLLRQQLEKDPNNTFAQMNFVRILRNEERFDEAIEHGKAFLEQYASQMSPMHRQMISNDVAYCLFITGQYEEAEKTCQAVLEENPDNLDVLFTLGCVLSKRGEYRQALGYFKKFLRAKREEEWRPEFTQLIVDTYTLENRVWNNLGECYRHMGLVDEAVRAYLRAIQLNPDEVIFYRNLAFVYIQQECLDDAKGIFQKVIERGIADELVYFGLGEVYRVQGDPERAIAAYRQAIAMKEDYADAHNALGQVLLAQGAVREAEAELTRALQIVPTHIGALLGLSKIHVQAGREKEALECMDRVVEIGPEDGKVFLHLAGICIGMRVYPRAIELFEDYLQSHPTDYKALTDLATCYLYIGKQGSALTGYQAALRLNPGYAPAAKHLQVLLQRA